MASDQSPSTTYKNLEHRRSTLSTLESELSINPFPISGSSLSPLPTKSNWSQPPYNNHLTSTFNEEAHHSNNPDDSTSDQFNMDYYFAERRLLSRRNSRSFLTNIPQNPIDDDDGVEYAVMLPDSFALVD